jgi:hypothetical protein
MKKQLLTLLTCGLGLLTFAQEAPKPTTPDVKFPELKKSFNEDGSHYIKATVLGQFWSRYTDLNPGTKLNGQTPNPFDMGIRRLRFNVWSQVTDRIFFYAQFGQNNFNYSSSLQTGAFFHDAVGEYKVFKNGILTLGTGLTGWSGLLRFSAPSVGSILGVDAPLYQQATNNVNDQFLRKLSIYAKGQIGKLDYRVIVSKPMLASNALSPNGALNEKNATFNNLPTNLQTQGYLQYLFFEKENNTLCYTTGTYLGKKKILNIGAGWIQQNKATWILSPDKKDTINHNMLLLGTDVFLELPLSEKRNAITAYVAFSSYNFGTKYIRNVGAMNPFPSGVLNATGTLNSNGNGVPLVGTGNTFYTQIAYKFKDNLFKENGTLQPYASVQYSAYTALKDPMALYEAGINWLINGTHNSKLTLGYQSRPIYTLNSSNEWANTSRKGMCVLQYQVSF